MRQILQKRWNEVGDKLAALAEDIPAERFEARATPETRSVAEHLRHVAFWNRYLLGSLAGGEPDGDSNELPAGEFPDKRRITPELRASFAEVARAVGEGAGELPSAAVDSVLAFIEHNGEHYGQLAVLHRLQGGVPPASR
jgi:hypothetical protein